MRGCAGTPPLPPKCVKVFERETLVLDFDVLTEDPVPGRILIFDFPVSLRRGVSSVTVCSLSAIASAGSQGSTIVQVESGSKLVMAVAISVVVFPRSFWRRTPS